jgi:hypothetical protein
MGPDVIDNQKERLADRMSSLLRGAVSARFAVGYLFLDGLFPLCQALQTIESAEFLVGNVVNRLTEEQVREEADLHVRGGEGLVREQEDVAATLRSSRDRTAVETALNLRMTLAHLPRTPEMRKVVITMAQRIADGGLKVRLYSEGRIHAKLALITYPCRQGAFENADSSPLAVVGSSNLTLGAAAHPTELNIIVRDRQSVIDLSEWYRNLWEKSQDFHRELFDEIGQSWALAAGWPDTKE